MAEENNNIDGQKLNSEPGIEREEANTSKAMPVFEIPIEQAKVMEGIDTIRNAIANSPGQCKKFLLEVEISAGKLVIQVRNMNELKRQNALSQEEHTKLWRGFDGYAAAITGAAKEMVHSIKEAVKNKIYDGLDSVCKKVANVLDDGINYLTKKKMAVLALSPKYKEIIAVEEAKNPVDALQEGISVKQETTPVLAQEAMIDAKQAVQEKLVPDKTVENVSVEETKSAEPTTQEKPISEKTAENVSVEEAKSAEPATQEKPISEKTAENVAVEATKSPEPAVVVQNEPYAGSPPIEGLEALLNEEPPLEKEDDIANQIMAQAAEMDNEAKDKQDWKKSPEIENAKNVSNIQSKDKDVVIYFANLKAVIAQNPNIDLKQANVKIAEILNSKKYSVERMNKILSHAPNIRNINNKYKQKKVMKKLINGVRNNEKSENEIAR